MHLLINKDMVTINTDVTIYIESFDDAFSVRYELRGAAASEDTDSINTRLRKSFSLGNGVPDAYTEPAILRKAELMKTIFRREYGLSAIIVDLIIR